MAGYQKNTWEVFDENIPGHEQPNAFITKEKLDRIEEGIECAITDFKIGTVSKGTDVYCEIFTDENDPSIKRINLVIPKEVSWAFSEVELYDQGVAPTGVAINDMILDSKGNIFTITKNSNDILILKKRINIKGEPGINGQPGEKGEPGTDGINGEDGKNGNKWVYINNNLFDGDEAPAEASVDDFILDNKSDAYLVLENHTLKKLFNLRGADGENGKDGLNGQDGKEYYLEIGDVSIGEEASATIDDHKLHIVIPVGPRGEQGIPGEKGEPGQVGPPGPAGESTYDIWKSLGNTGDAADFLESIRGFTGPAATVVDSLDSTSTTEALSANQGRLLKNNRLTTLDEILANEEEGIFVDALAVKELYLKMQEIIESLK